ncbi:hypothetical protein GUITHDRAFT_163131 [Guillardia theta CCMP2712]|uniref:Methyltransferase n=1 Tax=Guillardia theta (strain CCMP2712) TaxID=905079 RepID=L1JB70_GUITC|nr:hypothetical protein GUITHDRAFT_163131 [Guillardia theta CCMP2712]EKX45766.1 hypothetical protein GUITHDRAFT_163131 [Guillardia theta CCMP2712]|eukprot:XP_005832746.1 hypothetical protein GUITHDRAFT_163131 [Guillardia theta CCMP2712]
MARAKSSGLSRFARIQLIILALIFAVSFSAFMMIHPKHEMSDLQSYKESRSRRFCPSQCADGRAIDNRICPKMDPQLTNIILQSLRKDSKVVEWGSGASAIYFSQCVQGPKSVVWEWGSGTSTLYFSQCVGKWVSVEHEGAWCNQMRQLAPPNVEIRCVPIEEEYKESFGSPGKWDGSKREFKTYVEAIKEVKSWEQPPDALKYYDIVDVVEVPPPQSWRSASGLVKLRPKPEALANAKRAAERGEWNKLEER